MSLKYEPSSEPIAATPTLGLGGSGPTRALNPQHTFINETDFLSFLFFLLLLTPPPAERGETPAVKLPGFIRMQVVANRVGVWALRAPTMQGYEASKVDSTTASAETNKLVKCHKRARRGQKVTTWLVADRKKTRGA